MRLSHTVESKQLMPEMPGGALKKNGCKQSAASTLLSDDTSELEGIDLGEALLFLVIAGRLVALVELGLRLLAIGPRCLRGGLRACRHVVYLVGSSSGLLNRWRCLLTGRSHGLQAAIGVRRFGRRPWRDDLHAHRVAGPPGRWVGASPHLGLPSPSFAGSRI